MRACFSNYTGYVLSFFNFSVVNVRDFRAPLHENGVNASGQFIIFANDGFFRPRVNLRENIDMARNLRIGITREFSINNNMSAQITNQQGNTRERICHVECRKRDF